MGAIDYRGTCLELHLLPIASEAHARWVAVLYGVEVRLHCRISIG